MNCQQVRDGIALYVCSDLPEPERAAVEAHVRDCAECRGHLDQYRAVIPALARLGTPEAPVPDAERIWAGVARGMGWRTEPERVARPSGGRFRWGRGLLRAAAVFALGLGIGWATTLLNVELGRAVPPGPSLSARMSRSEAGRAEPVAADSGRRAGRLPVLGDFGLEDVQPVDTGSGRRFFVWNALPADPEPSRRAPAALRFHVEEIRAVGGDDLVAGY
jgi:anti-sigma factor RsiW